jgi:Zn finger protein HypA/HybF involved in hydrogenase expression
MVVKCKNCLPKEGIEVPDFDILEKNKLIELTVQSPLHSIKYIIDNFKLSHRDAKYIITHINRIYGQCNRCKFDNLDKEYMSCPKCGALNFNWKINNVEEI